MDNSLMNYESIYVVINDERIPYTRMYLANGFVNYFPYECNNKYCKDFGISHALFLPISKGQFNKAGRFTRYYGYQYRFMCSQMHTFVLEKNEAGIDNISHIQMISEVRRFKYKVNNKDIIIEKIFEPIYPPRIIDIDCFTSNAGMEILHQTKDLIDQFNSYYINKEV